MTDDRDQLLRRLLGPSGPRDPDAAAAWARLEADVQARLRWAATDPSAARHVHTGHHRLLVDRLAAERSVRRPWDLLAPVVVGLFVFSTLWGFGRAALPDVAGWFLLLGVLAGLVSTGAGLRRRAQLRSQARAVRAVLRGLDPPEG